MKSKVVKILLLSLICVLIFGSIAPTAYESYDTYTYSIDGEALPSPHAYTPDVETYNSQSMGLIAGHYWCYSDDEVAAWDGSMTPTKLGLEPSSEGLVLELNEQEDAYTVVGIDMEAFGSAKTLLIPATYDNIPVTAIAQEAFKSSACSSITAVVISENVSYIGASAFDGTAAKAIYTEADDEKWASVSVASPNKVYNNTFKYNYSETVKFGNIKLAASSDIIADSQGNLYIADTGNNRIVILNARDYKATAIINSYVDEYGRVQGFNGPTGVYVTDAEKMVDGSSHIFVCDTNNKRVVVFDSEYNYVRTISEPENALLDENDFTPYAIAVDIYGRIFIVSRNCDQGIIVMSGDGEFTGFIGAQKVTVNAVNKIWDDLMGNTGASLSLSMPFNNITVDDAGFVYVTINFTKPEELSQQLSSIKSKTSTYSPVKKLNSRGVEIMKRNGFFDPGGEVVSSKPGVSYKDVSKIIDVSLGNEGSWTILDANRSRLYTYDQNGNLLFAFGDKGDQVGNGVQYVAMTYQVVDGKYNLVLLDNAGSTGYRITVYQPTEYCDTIMKALHNQNNHHYSETIENWQEVLTSNNNFDLAYIGIGKALFNQGKYDEAMEMLSSAYETTYYSRAFTEVRKSLISKFMLPLLAVVIALIVLVVKFLGWAKKKNKATSLKVGQKTYGEELLYAFHLVFHPFDGFWDLKHEKRGSVRAAATILGITVIAFFYQGIGKGYMFNPRDTYSTILMQFISVIVPVFLWIVGNWCLTTLFDGEGSMKDIFVATCYSLAPLPVFVIISTILTNILTISEGSIVNLLVTFGYVWVGILLFFGMVVTHDYSTGKNVITTLGTIVAMCIIMFIAILFSSLVIKMVTFLVALVSEIITRLA